MEVAAAAAAVAAAVVVAVPRIDRAFAGKSIACQWIAADLCNPSYRCNQSGHFARDCPSDSNQSVCYNCNQPGSSQFQSVLTLFIKGISSGHLSRDCNEPRNSSNNSYGGSSGGGGGGGYRGSRGTWSFANRINDVFWFSRWWRRWRRWRWKLLPLFETRSFRPRLHRTGYTWRIRRWLWPISWRRWCQLNSMNYERKLSLFHISRNIHEKTSNQKKCHHFLLSSFLSLLHFVSSYIHI